LEFSSVAQVVTGVAAGVLLQIVLMVPFCRIESGSRNNLGDHLGRPLTRAIHLGLHALRYPALFVAVVEDRRAVLRASVVALAIGRGRVVQSKEVGRMFS